MSAVMLPGFLLSLSDFVLETVSDKKREILGLFQARNRAGARCKNDFHFAFSQCKKVESVVPMRLRNKPALDAVVL